MTEVTHTRFLIDSIFSKIFQLGNVSKEDKEIVTQALNKELLEKPFRVAIIGQSGVGKSTTLKAVFGLPNSISNLVEGTKNVVEKVYPMRDGFNLSI